MLVIDRKIFIFNIKEVYFSDSPFDIDNCDGIIFEYCKNKVDVEGFTRLTKLTSIIDLTQDLEKKISIYSGSKIKITKPKTSS